MKFFAIVIFTMSLIFSCTYSSHKRIVLEKKPSSNPQFHFEIISVNQNEFGYDIYEFNKKIIHQPNIPSIQGNKGFSQEIFAEKTAELVIKKLEANIMPPSISQDEINGILGSEYH